MANLKGNPLTGGRPFQQALKTLTTPTSPLTIGPRTESLNPFNTVFGIANRNQTQLLQSNPYTLQSLKPTPPTQPSKTILIQTFPTTKLAQLHIHYQQLKSQLAPPTRWIIR